jgi:hypothetical protein
MWTEALHAKFETGKPFGRAEFDNLLGKWGATTDQPAALMAEELIAAYPNAKVILVERDIDRWYRSYCETVINGTANPFIPLASMIDPTYLGQMRAQSEIIVKHCFNVQEHQTNYALVNNSTYFDAWRANAKSAYWAHNEMIKRITPKDRLLLFQLDEGWDPLCKFLDKPVPDIPFPRVNETAAVQEKINLYIAESYKRSLVNFVKRAAPAVVMLLAAFVWWKMC